MKNSKQRLVEVMSRLDKTFKPELNEDILDKNTIVKNIIANVGGDDATVSILEINRWMDERRNSWVSINFHNDTFYVQKAFENEALDDKYGVDIQIPVDYMNPNDTEKKLSKLFNYLTSQRMNDVSQLKNKFNEDNQSNSENIPNPAADFFPITIPLGTSDSELFFEVINQGIDSHLEGFTKSKFKKEGSRLILNFATSEVPLLLRRLEEIGTDEALQWKSDIESYDNNMNEDWWDDGNDDGRYGDPDEYNHWGIDVSKEGYPYLMLYSDHDGTFLADWSDIIPNEDEYVAIEDQLKDFKNNPGIRPYIDVYVNHYLKDHPVIDWEYSEPDYPGDNYRDYNSSDSSNAWMDYINENKTKQKLFRNMGRLDKTFKPKLNEDINTPTVLNGMNNGKARSIVGRVATKGYHTGIYRDESWEGVRGIYRALDNAGIDYDLLGSKYSPEFPNLWKEWKLSFKFVNDKGRETELIGTITAAGAGSVEQPLDRYDLNFTVY